MGPKNLLRVGRTIIKKSTITILEARDRYCPLAISVRMETCPFGFAQSILTVWPLLCIALKSLSPDIILEFIRFDCSEKTHEY